MARKNRLLTWFDSIRTKFKQWGKIKQVAPMPSATPITPLPAEPISSLLNETKFFNEQQFHNKEFMGFAENLLGKKSDPSTGYNDDDWKQKERMLTEFIGENLSPNTGAFLSSEVIDDAKIATQAFAEIRAICRENNIGFTFPLKPGSPEQRAAAREEITPAVPDRQAQSTPPSPMLSSREARALSQSGEETRRRSNAPANPSPAQTPSTSPTNSTKSTESTTEPTPKKDRFTP